jgi:hypothetical protein
MPSQGDCRDPALKSEITQQHYDTPRCAPLLGNVEEHIVGVRGDSRKDEEKLVTVPNLLCILVDRRLCTQRLRLYE